MRFGLENAEYEKHLLLKRAHFFNPFRRVNSYPCHPPETTSGTGIDYEMFIFNIMFVKKDFPAANILH